MARRVDGLEGRCAVRPLDVTCMEEIEHSRVTSEYSESTTWLVNIQNPREVTSHV